MKHLAGVVANTKPDRTYKPRHCAGPEQGETCFHDHPGEKSWRNFTTFGRRAS